MRRSWLAPLILWMMASAGLAATGPGDELLKLVPADSGAILAVEDLRGRAREVIGSSLFEGIIRLPSVRAWMASERFRKVEKASKDIQDALGITLPTARDDLLGDAVVLSLQPGPSGRPEQSKGLLMIKARDRPLIERLIRAFNDAQIRSGELDGVDPRSRGMVPYSARLYRALGRAPEFYVLLRDGTFAWSNSESMIQGVIDRKVSGRPGLGDDPGFRKVRGGLSDRPLASLYVNPRFLEAAMAEAPRPVGDLVAALVARYVGAVGQFGLSLEWRDGISLHSTESVSPEKLDPWLRDWLKRPSTPVVLPTQVSPATVAVASANLDAQVVLDALRDLVPADDRPALENLRLALRGMLLGLDPLAEVLPRLGPGAVLGIEVEPNQAIRPLFPFVCATGWSTAPGLDDLAGPVDNAMKTMLALHAFDSKHRVDHLRVESAAVGDARITVLTDGLRMRLAYRADRDRLVVGNSVEAVARFGTGRAPSTFAEIRARHFPEAGTFAIVDLTRLVPEVRSRKGPIARDLAARSNRPVASADRDLAELIAFAELFKAATFTIDAPRDPSEIRRTIGLIAR